MEVMGIIIIMEMNLMMMVMALDLGRDLLMPLI